MILDTSALLAILLREPEAQRFAVASYVEAAIYVERNGDEVRRAMLDTFLQVWDSNRTIDGVAGAFSARHSRVEILDIPI